MPVAGEKILSGKRIFLTRFPIKAVICMSVENSNARCGEIFIHRAATSVMFKREIPGNAASPWNSPMTIDFLSVNVVSSDCCGGAKNVLA